MTQARFAGRGRNSGHAGRGPGNGRGQGRGRGTGYTSKPKTSKVRLCKELENKVFDYGVPNAADLMQTTQEKIGQYVGIKYGEDIANKLVNKVWGPSIAMLKGKTVRTTPPVVRQDVIEIPKEIWELHKDITLAIDIFLSTRYHSSSPTVWSYAFCWLRT